MTVVWFREFGWTRTSLRFAIYEEAYVEKKITFVIEFEKCEIADMCKQIKDVLEAFGVKDEVKYQTGKDAFEYINTRTLNSPKTVYDVFKENGVEIEFPKGC